MHGLRCVLIIFILTTFTQTPRDMSFMPYFILGIKDISLGV